MSSYLLTFKRQPSYSQSLHFYPQFNQNFFILKRVLYPVPYPFTYGTDPLHRHSTLCRTFRLLPTVTVNITVPPGLNPTSYPVLSPTRLVLHRGPLLIRTVPECYLRETRTPVYSDFYEVHLKDRHGPTERFQRTTYYISLVTNSVTKSHLSGHLEFYYTCV